MAPFGGKVLMAGENTVKKEEAEDIWDGGGRSRAPQKAGVNQEKAQETKPKNFDFEKAINFEGIGEGGDESSKFKVQKPALRDSKGSKLGKGKKLGIGKFGEGGQSQERSRSGFIKDLVGTQLPQSYDFRGDAANEEEAEGGEGEDGREGEEGVEGEEGKGEGEEGREGGEGQVDEYDEEKQLNKDKREERKKKEGDAEEKVKIPEKIKMEVPGEIAWWILGMELWSLLFAPLFFLLILVEWIALKAVSVFKFPKWKKILTWVMFFAACFEIAIFVVLIVAIKETPGAETAIKVMSWTSRAKSAVSAGWNSLIGR